MGFKYPSGLWCVWTSKPARHEMIRELVPPSSRRLASTRWWSRRPLALGRALPVTNFISLLLLPQWLHFFSARGCPPSSLLPASMPNRTWTSGTQSVFLRGFQVDFERAREADELSTFFPPLYQKWFDKFPESDPTADEITKAGGDAEVAAERKLKKRRKVGILRSR